MPSDWELTGISGGPTLCHTTTPAQRHAFKEEWGDHHAATRRIQYAPHPRTARALTSRQLHMGVGPCRPHAHRSASTEQCEGLRRSTPFEGVTRGGGDASGAGPSAPAPCGPAPALRPRAVRPAGLSAMDVRCPAPAHPLLYFWGGRGGAGLSLRVEKEGS